MTALRIPPTLRSEVGGGRQVEAEGTTVRELLENGDVAPFVNVYLGGEDVRTLDGLDTAGADGQTLILLPAMAGGSC